MVKREIQEFVWHGKECTIYEKKLAKKVSITLDSELDEQTIVETKEPPEFWSLFTDATPIPPVNNQPPVPAFLYTHIGNVQGNVAKDDKTHSYEDVSFLAFKQTFLNVVRCTKCHKMSCLMIIVPIASL